MGWSCSVDASNTEKQWQEVCRALTGSSNEYRGADGRRYFYEFSRTEHDDGAITGYVVHMVNDTHGRKAGTFRINGDGTVQRWPRAFRPVVNAYATRVAPNLGPRSAFAERQAQAHT